MLPGPAPACDDRPRGADLRPARASGRRRALDRGRRVPASDRVPSGRRQRRGHLGLPPREPVPPRPGHDAQRRGRSAARARCDQPLPGHDGAHRGPVLPARGRPGAGGRVVRPRLRAGGQPPGVAADRAGAGRAVPGRCRPRGLGHRRVPRQACAGRGRRRSVRRLLDQRPRLRLGSPRRRPPWGHVRGASVCPARRPAATATHLRPAGGLAPGPGRAGPGLPLARRPLGRTSSPGAGPRDPAAAPRPGHVGDHGPGSCRSGSTRSPSPPHGGPPP